MTENIPSLPLLYVDVGLAAEQGKSFADALHLAMVAANGRPIGLSDGAARVAVEPHSTVEGLRTALEAQKAAPGPDKQWSARKAGSASASNRDV